MKNRVVIGRYMDRHSWVHRLDPRAKTGAMPLFMAAVFLIDTYEEVLTVFLFSVVVLYSTRISLWLYVKAVRPLIFLLLFMTAFHLIFDASGARLIDIGPFAIYAGGLERGLVSASRMTLFISFAALLTFTTQPDRIAQSLGSLLRPLRIIGLPIERLVLMLRIALRFLPTIFDEAERLWKAQQSRGMSLRDRPLKEKAGLLLALLVPVTAGVFRRSIGLADSMEARGYRINAPRTSYQALEWRGADSLFLLLMILLIVAVIVI